MLCTCNVVVAFWLIQISCRTIIIGISAAATASETELKEKVSLSHSAFLHSLCLFAADRQTNRLTDSVRQWILSLCIPGDDDDYVCNNYRAGRGCGSSETVQFSSIDCCIVSMMTSLWPGNWRQSQYSDERDKEWKIVAAGCSAEIESQTDLCCSVVDLEIVSGGDDRSGDKERTW